MEVAKAAFLLFDYHEIYAGSKDNRTLEGFQF